MVTVEQHQAKQDAIYKTKFRISILKDILCTTDNKNMKSIINKDIEELEELISVTENEHK